MRKHATIFGVVRCTGTSTKTNKPYDFTEIHFAYDDSNIIGQKCGCASIDTSALPYPVHPGDCVDMVFHYANGRCFIDAVL